MRSFGLGVLLLVGCETAAAVEAAPVARRVDAPTTAAPTAAPPVLPEIVLAASAPVTSAPAREEPDALQEGERVATIVREVYFGDRDVPSVALTFDDGPSRENTPRILDVLARYDVPATFFILGRRAELMPELVARTARDGHELANHSWSHGSLRSMMPFQIRAELDDTNAAIERISGVRPGLFRPPFGRYAPSALSIVGERDMNVVLWSVDSHDWESDPEQVAARVVHDTRAGDIVLLHDNRSAVVHALPAIIEGLRAKGLRLVTVSELTGLSPVSRAPTGADASAN